MLLICKRLYVLSKELILSYHSYILPKIPLIITLNAQCLADEFMVQGCLYNYYICTGKSFSEELILASTNPQYDKRLFIDLPVQYMKTTSSENVVYINCSECQNKNKIKNKKKQFVYTTFSELVVFMY